MAKISKLWKATKQARAGMQVTEDSAAIVGDSQHFVLADKKGVYLHGPVSIIAGAESRRSGGLFVGINDFLHMVPSTLISPIPQQVPIPPLFFIQNLAKDAAFFMAMVP